MLAAVFATSSGLNVTRNDQWTWKAGLRVFFRNESGRALRGIAGSVVVLDSFGNWLRSIPVQHEAEIAPDGAAFADASAILSAFDEEDRQIVGKDADELQLKWLPGKYVFADGTEMAWPESP